MSKLSKEQFEAYLEQIKNLAEGPFEEMQPEIEVTNVFPEKFYELAKENDLYRFALPAQYGGWDLSELDILRVQEQFSRGPGGMRMHLHYAADLNWRILDDYGSDELKAQYMDKFQDKTIFTCFALTEQSGGTGADIHTTAVKDENGDYILNGEKWLISHTDCSDYTYVIQCFFPADHCTVLRYICNGCIFRCLRCHSIFHCLIHIGNHRSDMNGWFVWISI